MEIHERAALSQELSDRARAAGESWSQFLQPDLEKARYRLGTSKADRILPYVIEDDLRQVFRLALAELAYLYVSRNRRILGEEAYDAVLLGSKDTFCSLREVAFSPPPQLKNLGMRVVIESAPRICPGLDCGVLSSWWGSEGKGRELLLSWGSLMSRGWSEMKGSNAGELTPFIMQWIFPSLINLSSEVLQDFTLDAEIRREVHAVLLLGLYLSHQVVQQRVLAEVEQSGTGNGKLKSLWSAVCNPHVAFLSAPTSMKLCLFYPIGLDLLSGRKETVIGTLDRYGNKKTAAALLSIISQNRSLQEKIAWGWLQFHLRELLIRILAAPIDQESEIFCFYQKMLRHDYALGDKLAEKKKRKELLREMDACSIPDGEAEPIRAFREVIAKFSAKNPARKIYSDAQLLDLSVQSLLVEAGDVLAAQIFRGAQGHFSLRTGSESDRSLLEEYDNGRLYRFSRKASPLLKEYRRSQNVGHYFIDVKDFTQRTALLKEEVMAEFVRQHFYEPILAMAQEYYQGLSHLEDRGGLYLNNLLGDAVSISGDVLSLVQLTRRIRQHLDEYERSLARHLEQADLLAGSFISYGAAPSVVTISDPVRGRVDVSIAEKINESARGTARTATVLASIQARLAHLRKQPGCAGLQLPFRVYVGNTLSLPLSPVEELNLRRSFVAANGQRALRTYTDAARRHIENTLSEGRLTIDACLSRGMALYNTGDAMSGTTLAAYREAFGGDSYWTELIMPTRELSSALTQRFAFLQAQLRLWVRKSKDGKVEELFHYAGTVIFKGFERDIPIEIWEIIGSSDSIAYLLSEMIQAHTLT